MVKKVYIAPTINVVRVNAESMIAESGPMVSSSTGANQADGMDVKEDRGGFFDDEW